MTAAIFALLPLVLPLYAVRLRIGPLPMTLLEVALIALIAAWTWSRRGAGWRNGWMRLEREGWLAPLGLWLLAGTLGVMVAPDHLGALGLWRAYFLEPALIFVMLADLLGSSQLTRPHQFRNGMCVLVRSLVVINILVALWAVMQMFGLLPIPSPWDVPPTGIRATGPFPYPNALALFAVPIAGLCVSLLSFPTSPFRLLVNDRIILIVGIGSGLVATLLARSDGGLVALAAAAFVALVLRKTTRVPTVVATVLLGLALLAIPATRTAVADQLLFRGWSGKVRLVMWDETVTMLKDRPLFGAGLGAYPDVIAPYHAATWMEIFQYPHHILLNLWSETGLLGVVAFGWILVLWIRRGGRTALPVIAAIAVHGLVDVPYFKNDLAILFWILVAVTAFPSPVIPAKAGTPPPVIPAPPPSVIPAQAGIQKTNL
ncbi:O-antigen ligase family protein [Candidatus Uhrbacteria bacterium]|nr:O-antigen ligase family protein [Candidatus Uhrbacteria bacterium]